MGGSKALAVLSAESGLLLLVDDLVETLVQEDGQLLSLGVGGWRVAGMVVGDLADVIRGVRHMRIIVRFVNVC